MANRTQRRLRKRFIAAQISEQNADPRRKAARERAREQRTRESVEQKKLQEARPRYETLRGRAKREIAEMDAWLAQHNFDAEHIAWIKEQRCDRATGPDNLVTIYSSNGLTPWFSAPCCLYLFQTAIPGYRKFGISKNPEERARTCKKHEKQLYKQSLAVYEASSRAEALLIENAIQSVYVEQLESKEITEMDASQFLKHCKDRAKLIQKMGIREYMKLYTPVEVRWTATAWVNRGQATKRR